jgi:hypothetical protein
MRTVRTLSAATVGTAALLSPAAMILICAIAFTIVVASIILWRVLFVKADEPTERLTSILASVLPGRPRPRVRK